MFANLTSSWKTWVEERRARRTERLTRQADDLDPETAHDLADLSRRGFVRARATGLSITNINMAVENLISRPLRVVVRPGTYFVARGDFQNMATRKSYTFTLQPNSPQNISIEAACINAGRPIPTESARFDGVERAPADVGRFLEAAQDANPMVVQAGVWALTDGLSGRAVQARLVSQDRYGNRRRAVSDADILEARRILAELSIRNPL